MLSPRSRLTYNALERNLALVIKYFADIRLLAKCSEQQLTAEVPTVHSLLSELASQHGEAFRKRVLQDGKLSKTVVVMVNGQNVRQLAGLDTALASEDSISILPVVAGG